jgi:hypothetical protein
MMVTRTTTFTDLLGMVDIMFLILSHLAGPRDGLRTGLRDRRSLALVCKATAELAFGPTFTRYWSWPMFVCLNVPKGAFECVLDLVRCRDDRGFWRLLHKLSPPLREVQRTPLTGIHKLTLNLPDKTMAHDLEKLPVMFSFLTDLSLKFSVRACDDYFWPMFAPCTWPLFYASDPFPNSSVPIPLPLANAVPHGLRRLSIVTKDPLNFA